MPETFSGWLNAKIVKNAWKSRDRTAKHKRGRNTVLAPDVMEKLHVEVKQLAGSGAPMTIAVVRSTIRNKLQVSRAYCQPGQGCRVLLILMLVSCCLVPTTVSLPLGHSDFVHPLCHASPLSPPPSPHACTHRSWASTLWWRRAC